MILRPFKQTTFYVTDLLHWKEEEKIESTICLIYQKAKKKNNTELIAMSTQQATQFMKLSIVGINEMKWMYTLHTCNSIVTETLSVYTYAAQHDCIKMERKKNEINSNRRTDSWKYTRCTYMCITHEQVLSFQADIFLLLRYLLFRCLSFVIPCFLFAIALKILFFRINSVANVLFGTLFFSFFQSAQIKRAESHVDRLTN